jgi:uncharacterized membrane protein
MKAKDFLNKLDEARVVEAIRLAELETSGEIRVFVSRQNLGTGEDVMTRAAKQFEKLGLTATRERNGVLIYFMPHAQKFAILGDKGIDEKCGLDFWQSVAARIGEQLRNDHFTDAVTEAVGLVGEALGRHFPRRPDDRDELSNEVEKD